MKTIVKLLVTIALGVSCTFFLSGCGGGDDHAGHNHEEGDHDHAHTTESASTENTADPLAGALSGAVKAAGEAANEAATGLAEEVEKMTDEAIIKAQEASYALKKCVISGEELGSMGDAVNYVHEGTLIKVCCENCLPDLKKEPAKYVAMVKEAATQQ